MHTHTWYDQNRKSRHARVLFIKIDDDCEIEIFIKINSNVHLYALYIYNRCFDIILNVSNIQYNGVKFCYKANEVHTI